MRRATLLLALAALAGCGDGDAAGPTIVTETVAPQPTTTATVTATRAESLLLRVYFLRDGRLAAATREVEATEAVAAAALEELLEGVRPTEEHAGMTTAMPDEMQLRRVSIANGVAMVEFSREKLPNAAAAQVVHTLTQFPTVRSVRLGSVVATRGDYEHLSPPILVESPTPGGVVSSPLVARGTANTFEATLFLKIVDPTGKTLVDRLVTATSGSGTRGTFEATLRFEVEEEGIGTLVAYERSAENGEPIHVVRIPVTLER